MRLRFRTFRQRIYLLSFSPTVRREEHGKPKVRDVSVSPDIDAYAVGRVGSCDRPFRVDGSPEAGACLRADTRLRATRGQAHRQALREVAGREGWLEASSVMPDDATLAQVLDVPSSRRQSASSVLPYQDKVTVWWRQGIRGTVIH